jgi:DNA polymerase-4
LFDDTEERINLYQAMDKMRNRYGDRSVVTAAGMNAHSIGRGDNPFAGGPPLLLANRRS